MVFSIFCELCFFSIFFQKRQIKTIKNAIKLKSKKQFKTKKSCQNSDVINFVQNACHVFEENEILYDSNESIDQQNREEQRIIAESTCDTLGNNEQGGESVGRLPRIDLV